MTYNQQTVSFLDVYKKDNGIDQLKNNFYNTGKQNKQTAAAQINHPNLTFPTFYVLISEIDALSLYNLLNFRNAAAIQICSRFLRDDVMGKKVSIRPVTNEQQYPVLKWMFTTGWQEDGLSNQFDQILDIATGILIKKYNDQSTLPTIVHEIFERNRKGLFIHDLIWNFYQARNLDALKLVAQYLRSSDPQDVKLACAILHFTPEREQDVHGDPQNKYDSYLSWLQENQPYLYFSGESLQYSSEPDAFKVNLNAKYLAKKESAAAQPLNSFEQKKLGQFRQIQDHDRKLLAKYSCRMHDHNPQQWNQWMRADIQQQLQTAKGQEGTTP